MEGAVTNNYVKFANKIWRIIRINGDGSIRIIYDGIAYTSAFNSSYNNNMYVGFKYTSGQVHGTGTKSTILTNLETWYTSNLANYATKIDINAGFCGDRTPSTSKVEINNRGGTGEEVTYYAGYIRLSTGMRNPNLMCSAEDLYTIKESENGNKSLTYPVGLITADEVVYAGGFGGKSNGKYYLYTGQEYWTMSPYSYSSSETYRARLFVVTTVGQLNSGRVILGYGMRPVINLRSDVELTGTGTMSDPYVVVGGN